MICKICGYESDNNVSTCLNCEKALSFEKEENTSSSNKPNETEENPPSDKSNSKQTNYSNYELRLDDVEIPFNLNKDVIEKNSNSDVFIINDPIGGDFFPNRFILPIYITGLVLLILGTYFINRLCNSFNVFYIFIFFIFLGLSIYFCIKLTNNKAKFKFSSNGIDITSKEGSLFIPKEDIKSVYVKETIYPKKSTKAMIQHKYVQYDMILEFKQPVHIPNTNNDKTEVKLLKEYNIKSSFLAYDFTDSKCKKDSIYSTKLICTLYNWYRDVKSTKNFAYYIVQEINRILCL